MWHRHMVGALRELGWRGDPALALRAFQTGYALGPALRVDGVNGPLTREAIRRSLGAHRAGRPDLAPHFRWAEFACRCGGLLPGCRGILVRRELVTALERYRAEVGHGVDVVSGYRCPQRNRRVGGASNSQHLHGAAADVELALPVPRVQRLGAFSGIGRAGRTGLVRHVDVRHLSGHNSTGGTPARPTVWVYAT